MLDGIGRTEACELLEPQTSGFLPSAIDDGFWYASPDRSWLGVILSESDGWRFVLLRRLADAGDYLRLSHGGGYSTLAGAERSMGNRAEECSRRLA
jgi:hypothetical protein